MTVATVEHSRLTAIAAWKLGQPRMAMVLGNKILLHNVSRQDFLANTCWLRHELAHVEQYHRYGFFSFLVRYLWQSLKHGYHNNKFEREARQAESDRHLPRRYGF